MKYYDSIIPQNTYDTAHRADAEVRRGIAALTTQMRAFEKPVIGLYALDERFRIQDQYLGTIASIFEEKGYFPTIEDDMLTVWADIRHSVPAYIETSL